MLLLLTLTCMACAVNAAPLAQHMVDMTYTFDETTLYYPTMKKFELDTVRNGSGDDGLWKQVDEIATGVHVGTHMDAPSHFTRGGIPIDQIPVDRFFAPAAVVDITAKAAVDRDYGATVEDLLQWESVTGESLDGKILLLRSGWGKKWGNRTDYYGTHTYDANELHGPGLDASAARWLVDNRNIYGIGVETLSFDVGSVTTKDVHVILLGHGVYGIENMANMDKIPIYGAMLHVLPMKLGNSGGAPTRVVATFPKVILELESVEDV